MVYTMYWKDTKFMQRNVTCKEEKETFKPDRDPKKEFWSQNDLYHLKLEEKNIGSMIP